MACCCCCCFIIMINMTAVCVCVFRYKRKNSRIYVYTRYTDNYSQIDGISYLVSLRNVWFSRKCEKKLCNSPSGNTQLNSRYLCHITHTVTCCVQPNIGLVDRIYYIWYNLLHTAQRSKREGLVYNVLLGY